MQTLHCGGGVAECEAIFFSLQVHGERCCQPGVAREAANCSDRLEDCSSSGDVHMDYMHPSCNSMQVCICSRSCCTCSVCIAHKTHCAPFWVLLMLCHICLDTAGLSLGFAMLQVAQRDARIAALEEICRHRDSSATPAKQVHLSPHPESAPTALLLQAAAVHTHCVAGLHMHHTMPMLLTMPTLHYVEH